MLALSLKYVQHSYIFTLVPILLRESKLFLFLAWYSAMPPTVYFEFEGQINLVEK